VRRPKIVGVSHPKFAKPRQLGPPLGDDGGVINRGGLLRAGDCGVDIAHGGLRGQGSDAQLQAGCDEIIKIAIEHRTGVADLHVGTEILDARLIQNI
jgi:hypothetical protein